MNDICDLDDVNQHQKRDRDYLSHGLDIPNRKGSILPKVKMKNIRLLKMKVGKQ